MSHFQRLLGAIALSASMVLAVSCGCTEVGCLDTVLVTIAGFGAVTSGGLPATVRVCVDTDCSNLTIDSGQSCTVEGPTFAGQCSVTDTTLSAQIAGVRGDGLTVSVEVMNANGDRVYSGSTGATTTSFYQPNGPFCGPTCRQSTASFTATTP